MIDVDVSKEQEQIFKEMEEDLPDEPKEVESNQVGRVPT